MRRQPRKRGLRGSTKEHVEERNRLFELLRRRFREAKEAKKAGASCEKQFYAVLGLHKLSNKLESERGWSGKRATRHGTVFEEKVLIDVHNWVAGYPHRCPSRK